jgi:hypothetical protein
MLSILCALAAAEKIFTGGSTVAGSGDRAYSPPDPLTTAVVGILVAGKRLPMSRETPRRESAGASRKVADVIVGGYFGDQREAKERSAECISV